MGDLPAVDTPWERFRHAAARQWRWDQYFLMLAVVISSKSKDQSTKCGCVLAGAHNDFRSAGYNGPPPGVDDDVPERHERPGKYLWFEHAERNSVFYAARHGASTDDCTAYITAPPCADCARALIVAGIKRVVVPKNHNLRDKSATNRGSTEVSTQMQSRWKDSMAASTQMFREAGVKYVEVEFDVDAALAVLTETFEPFRWKEHENHARENEG